MKRHPACGAPLILIPHLYVGETNNSHLQGNKYHVVKTGYHWEKKYGFVCWVTTEEQQSASDIDYCMSMPISDFNKDFINP